MNIAEHPIRNGLITAATIWAGFIALLAILEYRALGRTEKAKIAYAVTGPGAA